MGEVTKTMCIQVCYAMPKRHLLIEVANLPTSATLHEAITASGILRQVPEIDLSVCKVGVYGKLKSLDAVLHDRDRVEIYRPLTADPMESRRRRVLKRGSRAEK